MTELNPQGTGLDYSTYLGGTYYNGAYGIAIDGSGDAYVTGSTTSTDFPTTADAFQTKAGGADDAFVTELNPLGSGLVYSTYLGGDQYDHGTGIAVDRNGSVYVTGFTSSANFPTTAGAFQSTLGSQDAYVTRLPPHVIDPTSTPTAAPTLTPTPTYTFIPTATPRSATPTLAPIPRTPPFLPLHHCRPRQRSGLHRSRTSFCRGSTTTSVRIAAKLGATLA